MKAVAERQPDHELTLYVGNRKQSKTDNLILFDFLRKVFEHNYSCERKDRLQDDDIRRLVAAEFEEPKYLSSVKHYVAVWRNLFNSGRLHKRTSEKRTFVAFRVNRNLQFTKSTYEKPLTLDQLDDEYNTRNGKNLVLSVPLIQEVKGYATE